MTYKHLRFQGLPEDIKDLNRLFIFAEEGNWVGLVSVLNRSAKHLKELLPPEDMQNIAQELYITLRLNDNSGLSCRTATQLGFIDKIDSFELEYRKREVSTVPKMTEGELRKLYGLYK